MFTHSTRGTAIDATGGNSVAEFDNVTRNSYFRVNVGIGTTAPETKLSVRGVPITGTGSTSFPLVYINDDNATASTTLNTAGTYFGVNGDGSQETSEFVKRRRKCV